MSFRVLHYIMRILDRYIKDAQNKNKEVLPLPYVFPMIYYNGKIAYTGERFWFALFGEYKTQMQAIFNESLPLFDGNTHYLDSRYTEETQIWMDISRKTNRKKRSLHRRK